MPLLHAYYDRISDSDVTFQENTMEAVKFYKKLKYQNYVGQKKNLYGADHSEGRPPRKLKSQMAF